MCSIDSGLWCWDTTTQAASDDAPSQRRGWRGVLSFSFEVRVRQGRVTLPCNSLRGVRAPNIYLVMQVWFPRREYAVGPAPQGHSYDRICCHENDPCQLLIGKLRSVPYPIYMTSVLQRSVMTLSCSHIEKGTQLRLDTVCGGPYSGLLRHTTSHRRAVWSIALLTPTSVPLPIILRWGYSITPPNPIIHSPINIHPQRKRNKNTFKQVKN